MALATYLMSRAQYEDRCRERLESLNPDDPERVARALLHRYPATSEQAAAELRRRVGSMPHRRRCRRSPETSGLSRG